jgi:hypothetical protein
MKILDFLFGKKPLITFTDDGRAKHEHSAEKWQGWKNRFASNPSYDWKQHVGTKSGKSVSKK